jgi:hypothetical protein
MMVICRHCGIEFDPKSAAKIVAGGYADECYEHATDLVQKVIGEMIWSHKTAPALQVSTPGGKVKHKADLAQSRRGDVPNTKSSKQELIPFAKSSPARDQGVPQAVWFDPSSRMMFRLDVQGHLFGAELPTNLVWQPVKRSLYSLVVSKSKDHIQRALLALQKLC